jgi:hypothetical protein
MGVDDNYTPSAIIRKMHGVAHLNSDMQREDNTFAVTYEDRWNDYTMSLLPVPIICGSIALLVLLFVILYQCRTYCTRCCPRKHITEDDSYYETLWSYRVAFLVAIFLVLFFVQAIIFGNIYLTRGVHSTNDTLDYLQATFLSLNNSGAALHRDGDQLDQDLRDTRCRAAKSLRAGLPAYFNAVEQYQALVFPIPLEIEHAQELLQLYGVDYKNRSVWVFYAVFTVCALILALGMALTTPSVFWLGSFLSNLLLIASFVLCGIVMAILVSICSVITSGAG